jgi:hypothetical protein
MSATSISFGLLIALFTILLLPWLRRLKPQLAGFQSQKDVPILRIDHVPIKGALLGVWQAAFRRVLDFKEMNRPVFTV